MAKNNTSTFTTAEELLIQKSIEETKEKERQMAIEAEALDRLLTAQSQQPGYKYY